MKNCDRESRVAELEAENARLSDEAEAISQKCADDGRIIMNLRVKNITLKDENARLREAVEAAFLLDEQERLATIDTHPEYNLDVACFPLSSWLYFIYTIEKLTESEAKK